MSNASGFSLGHDIDKKRTAGLNDFLISFDMFGSKGETLFKSCRTHVCCVQAEVDVRRVVHLYHDLQRNVGIKQIYCSYMRALHRQGKHLRHLSSGRKTFQGTKTFFLQERADDSHTTERNCHLD